MNSHRSRQRRRRIAHARGLFRAYSRYVEQGGGEEWSECRVDLLVSVICAGRVAGWNGPVFTHWLRQKGFAP